MMVLMIAPDFWWSLLSREELSTVRNAQSCTCLGEEKPWCHLEFPKQGLWDIGLRQLINSWDLAIQFSSVTQSCLTLRPHELQHSSLPCPSSHPCPLNRWMQSNHLILCRPLLLQLSIFPSIRVFSNESALCIKWLKYGSFSFNISPSNEHPMISFRMDWLRSNQSKGLSRVLSNTTVQKH